MTISTPTPHNSAAAGEIAQTVLMPGDPKRARRIAERFLSNSVLFNDVRGVQGYTGKWQGRAVSVMASGMGIPSIAIYATELYEGYGVESIIRVGTAGALRDDLNLRDLVIGQGASTDSHFMNQFKLPGSFAPLGDYGLIEKAVRLAREKALRYQVGNLLSSDLYYSAAPEDLERWKRMGVLAVEMEAAGLYAVAASHGKKALALCTVSNHIFKDEELSAAEREQGVDEMLELALDLAVE